MLVDIGLSILKESSIWCSSDILNPKDVVMAIDLLHGYYISSYSGSILRPSNKHSKMSKAEGQV